MGRPARHPAGRSPQPALRRAGLVAVVLAAAGASGAVSCRGAGPIAGLAAAERLELRYSLGSCFTEREATFAFERGPGGDIALRVTSRGQAERRWRLTADDVAVVESQLAQAGTPATAGCVLVGRFEVVRSTSAGPGAPERFEDRSCSWQRPNADGWTLEELAWR